MRRSCYYRQPLFLNQAISCSLYASDWFTSAHSHGTHFQLGTESISQSVSIFSYRGNEHASSPAKRPFAEEEAILSILFCWFEIEHANRTIDH